MGSTAKAMELEKKADKKLSSFSFFGNKYEDAAELLEKAANQYKLAKAWKEAGRCFDRLAEVHAKTDSKHEAASSFVEASKCYQKVSKPDAIRALNSAVEYYTEMGRFGMAARQLKDVAETIEKTGSHEDAAEYYGKAAELYDGESQTAEATRCRLKVAEFSAEAGRYSEAVEIYESTAQNAVENNLLKFSAKGYLLNAGLCTLAGGDDIALQNNIERYDDIDINFGNSRERKFLQELCEACKEGDVEKFTGAVTEWDSLTKLDAWKTRLLLAAKKQIQAREQGDDDLT